MPLQEKGLIDGITPVSEREWEMRRRAEWGWPKRQLFTRREDGTMEKAIMPPLPPAPTEEDFFHYGEDPYVFPAFDDDTNGTEGAVTITVAGWEMITKQLADHLSVPKTMPDLKKLVDAELYDSALREVGIAVEEELRRLVGNEDGFGQRLVGEFIKHLGEELFAYNTTLKIYRLRLRTFFKFVRNPHAHRKISLPRAHALALTTRALFLLEDLQQFRAEEQQ
jgi:acetyl esterase/lipase